MDLKKIGWGSVEWIHLAQMAGIFKCGYESVGFGATELEFISFSPVSIYRLQEFSKNKS
jgi:hypothetical protein